MADNKRVVYPDADGDELEKYKHYFDRIRDCAELAVFTGRPETEEEYIERIADAQGILLGWDLPGKVMEKATLLECVSFTGTGAAKFVDLEQARKRGIVVTNCPGYADVAVAEHAMALLFACSRNIPEFDKELKSGIWSPSSQITELSGKQIGLIGFGGIGQIFSRMCTALGLKVVVWTRSMNRELEKQYNVTLMELNDLIESSQIVSLHLASTPETEGIIDHAMFEKMRYGSIFINTARAELVDEDALVRALRSGHVAKAGIDVFSKEPLPAGHAFHDLKNVIVTPHVAYNTPEAVDRLFKIAIDNLVSYLQGNIKNSITV